MDARSTANGLYAQAVRDGRGVRLPAVELLDVIAKGAKEKWLTFAWGEREITVERSRLHAACSAMDPFEDVQVHIVCEVRPPCGECVSNPALSEDVYLLVSWRSRSTTLGRGELRLRSQCLSSWKREGQFFIALPESPMLEVVVAKREKKTFRQERAERREAVKPIKRPAKAAPLTPTAPAKPAAPLTPLAPPAASTGDSAASNGLELDDIAARTARDLNLPPRDDVRHALSLSPDLPVVVASNDAAAAWGEIGAKPVLAPAPVVAQVPPPRSVDTWAEDIVAMVERALNDPRSNDVVILRELAKEHVKASLLTVLSERPGARRLNVLPRIEPVGPNGVRGAAPRKATTVSAPPAGYSAEDWAALSPARKAWATRRAAAAVGT